MSWRSVTLGVLVGCGVAVLGAAGQEPIDPKVLAAERAAANTRVVQRLKASIAGREQQPAGKVFKNIRLQIFKRVPAGDLLDVMQGGYSRALGVTCAHCHDEDDFSSDAKRPKRAAREMALMHRGINTRLATMKNLESDPEDRFVNCGTCHRGTLRPQQPLR
jgi:hypothetical protein